MPGGWKRAKSCGVRAPLRVLFLTWFAFPATGTADPLPAVDKAKRLLFLGDSITYGGRYVTCVEAWLTIKHPDPQRRVFNLGLPSETVSGLSEEKHAGGAFPRPDLHERLERVLDGVRPDLVIACYGINCGIYQGADEGRFRAFREGMEKLHQAVTRRRGEIIHLTPWPYDHLSGRIAVRGYNDEVLSAYAQWLLEQRRQGWHVIDLHGAMMAELAKRRKDEASFTFQQDGVHPGEEGHWFAAQLLLRAFGDAESAQCGDAQAMMAQVPEGGKMLALLQERMVLQRNAWLSSTGHLRPGLRAGLPLPEARLKAAELGSEIYRLLEGAPKK